MKKCNPQGEQTFNLIKMENYAHANGGIDSQKYWKMVEKEKSKIAFDNKLRFKK